jgi:hypothetical protein
VGPRHRLRVLAIASVAGSGCASRTPLPPAASVGLPPAPPVLEPAGTARVVTPVGHAAGDGSVVFSPDGAWVLTGSGDGSAKL